MKTALTITLNVETAMNLQKFAVEKDLKVSKATEFILNAYFSIEPNKTKTKSLKTIKKEIMTKKAEIANLSDKEKKITTQAEQERIEQEKRISYFSAETEQQKQNRLRQEAIEDYKKERAKKPKIKFSEEDQRQADELQQQEDENKENVTEND